MKKILLISLITILAVGLVGCNNKDVEVDNSNNVIESGNNNSENNNTNDESNNLEEDKELENNEVESGETENGEVNTNELEGKLNSLAEKAEIQVRAPMTIEISSETSSTYIGLTEELFNENVASAMAYESMMMPSNFSLCLIELKDTADVANMKKQVIDNCDPNKWICMGADKCLVVDSGKYIMLVMSTDEDCTALQNAFASEFGNLGEVLTK